MKFGRSLYRGRLTKWQNLAIYMNLRKTKWPVIRNLQKGMLLEGSMSVQDYLFDQNLLVTENVKWIEAKLLQAVQSPSTAIGFWNRIDICKLRQCVLGCMLDCARIESYTWYQNCLPLVETAGYIFNLEYKISPEEIKCVLENELGFTESELLVDF